VAGTLLTAMLWPAFRRLQKLNRDLALRGDRLQRANEELALAARASAVGAVSAHLMHGLKNPLASLSQFVTRGRQDHAEPEEDEWQDALTASRRMQSLVEQTLEVLADVRGDPVYELTVGELLDEVKRRVAAAAQRDGVQLDFSAAGNCMFSSRTANLCSLILVNLLENAIGATSAGGSVRLAAELSGELVCFRVTDQGPGFPDDLRDQLFLPCLSTHEGGSGIGLAISKQIAEFLGAKLELESSSSEGCCFLLALPQSACIESD
jgi:signal transduction histidine kinase